MRYNFCFRLKHADLKSAEIVMVEAPDDQAAMDAANELLLRAGGLYASVHVLSVSAPEVS